MVEQELLNILAVLRVEPTVARDEPEVAAFREELGSVGDEVRVDVRKAGDVLGVYFGAGEVVANLVLVVDVLLSIYGGFPTTAS